MGARKPELAEPVKVYQEWINRRHDALTGVLSTLGGTNIADLRKYAMSREGKLVPTSKGIAVKVNKLPQLLEAVQMLIQKAQELGLLDEAGE
ncbi:hypothetical protein [Bradyrhizobium sp. 23AC]